MQNEETMDLKQSNGANGESDAYIPNSKSTDLIKPSKSGNLDNLPGSGGYGEYLLRIVKIFTSNINKTSICRVKCGNVV